MNVYFIVLELPHRQALYFLALTLLDGGNILGNCTQTCLPGETRRIYFVFRSSSTLRENWESWAISEGMDLGSRIRQLGQQAQQSQFLLPKLLKKAPPGNSRTSLGVLDHNKDKLGINMNVLLECQRAEPKWKGHFHFNRIDSRKMYYQKNPTYTQIIGQFS